MPTLEQTPSPVHHSQKENSGEMRLNAFATTQVKTCRQIFKRQAEPLDTNF